jgi:hypothetical protein
VDWIVDVCDASAGWFIGTAIAYNETTDAVTNPSKVKTVCTVTVCLPDVENPTWQGDVVVNWQMLRLVECCDASTVSLYNELAKESIVPVDWNVEWCEPETGEEEEEEEDAYFTEGHAAYCVRLLNSLVCKVGEMGGGVQEVRGVTPPNRHPLMLLTLSSSSFLVITTSAC